MSSAVVPQAPVPSPCINVCRIEPGSGLCAGCLRTLDEIACWSQSPDELKRAIWVQIGLRRASRLPATPAPTASAAATASDAPTGIARGALP